MVICAVATCTSNQGKNSSKLSFFQFPREPLVRAEWVKKCSRDTQFNPQYARVCSLHFTADDLERSCVLKRSLGLKCNMFLKPHVVPTRNLPPDFDRDKSLDALHQAEYEDASVDMRNEGRNMQQAPTMDYVQQGTIHSEQEKLNQDPSYQPKENERPFTLTGVITLRRNSSNANKYRNPCFPESDSKVNNFAQINAEELRNPTETGFGRLPSVTVAHSSKGGYVGVDNSALRMETKIALDVHRCENNGCTDTAPGCRVLPYAATEETRQSAAANTPALSASCKRVKRLLRRRRRISNLERHCARLRPTEKTSQIPQALATADSSLLVLRESVDDDDIVSVLRAHQLPPELESFSPTDLQQSIELIHQLKVKYLALKEHVLRWAIRCKHRQHAERGPEPQQADPSADSAPVSEERLNYLLSMEKGFQRIFSSQQIKAVIADYDGMSKMQRKVVLWKEEDFKKTLLLRNASNNKVVNFVRQQLKIPIPCMTSVLQNLRKYPALNELYHKASHRASTKQDSRRWQQDPLKQETADAPTPERASAAIDDLTRPELPPPEIYDDLLTFGEPESLAEMAAALPRAGRRLCDGLWSPRKRARREPHGALLSPSSGVSWLSGDADRGAGAGGARQRDDSQQSEIVFVDGSTFTVPNC